jgi:peptide/nickel transport system substrate-binding protein
MPSINGANPDVEIYPYDPEAAQKLLAEARADGVPIDQEILFLTTSGDPGAIEAATVLVDMMNTVGLNVKLQILENADHRKFYFRPYPEGQPVHILSESHDNNTGDAGITLLAKYHSKGGTSKLEDPAIDALIERGLEAENPERAEIFKQVFQKVHDMAADVVMYHQTGNTRVNPRIHFQPSSATNSELQLAQISFAK